MAKLRVDEEYLDYVESVLSSLTNDEVYQTFKDSVAKGTTRAKVYQTISEKKVDDEWLTMIEETVIALDDIIRNPRKFIKQVEDIVPISLSRQITTDSVKHLATHTNLISMTEDNEIAPHKILNIQKEESFDIYENRFIYTLLIRLRDFIAKRFNIIKDSLEDNSKARVTIQNTSLINGKEFTYSVDVSQGITAEEILHSKNSSDKLSGVQRVAKISAIVEGFMGSSFMTKMKGCVPVRPPITRTNVILKDPKFRQALVLWQFIETYEKIGYVVETKHEEKDPSSSMVAQINRNMFLNYLMMKEIDVDSDKDEFERDLSGIGYDEMRKGREGKGPGTANILKNKLYRVMIDDAVNKGEINEKDLKIILRRVQYQRKIISREETRAINEAIDRVLNQETIYQNYYEKKREEERLKKLKEIEEKKKLKEAQKAKKREEALKRKEAEKLKKQKLREKEKERKRLLKEKEQAKILKQKEKEKALLLKQKERARIQEEKQKEKERLLEEKRKKREELKRIAQEKKELADRKMKEAAEKVKEEMHLKKEAALAEKNAALAEKKKAKEEAEKLRAERLAKRLKKKLQEEDAEFQKLVKAGKYYNKQGELVSLEPKLHQELILYIKDLEEEAEKLRLLHLDEMRRENEKED